MQLPSPLGIDPSLPRPVMLAGGFASGGVLAATPNSTIAAGVTSFAAWSQGFSSPESVRQLALPAAVTVTALSVYIGTAQPAGQSLTFAVRRNGINTALNFVIPGGSPVGVYSVSGNESFAANDLFSLLASQQAGASASASIVSWAVAI